MKVPVTVNVLIALLVAFILPLLFGCSALSLGLGGRESAGVRALVIQTDGRPVAAGFTCIGNRCDFALARYLPDGGLDTSFGVDGKVVTHFRGSAPAASSMSFAGSFARAIAVQPDGKLVAAGVVNLGSLWTITPTWAIARYLPDGGLDRTFGLEGMVTTVMAGSYMSGYAMPTLALQPDGKLVFVAHDITGKKFNKLDQFGFVLVRFLPDGRIDHTFGGNGTVKTGFPGGFASARALTVQPDGKLVAAGFAFIDGRDRFALARYLPDGSLDPSFGEAGVVTTVVNFEEKGRITQGFLNRGAFALELQRDGKLISVGASEGLNGRTVFALVRFHPDGSLDRAFGTGGTVATDFGDGGVAFALVLQPDDKVVVAGTSGIAGLSRTGGDWPCEKFALARYLPNGTLDGSFGADGKVIGDQCGRPMAVGVQLDGKLIVAGRTIVGELPTFTLARYLTDGTLDPTFGVGGKVTTDFAGAKPDPTRIQR
jgi:uncharacterized delta-60 repeat protein